MIIWLSPGLQIRISQIRRMQKAANSSVLSGKGFILPPSSIAFSSTADSITTGGGGKDGERNYSAIGIPAVSGCGLLIEGKGIGRKNGTFISNAECSSSRVAEDILEPLLRNPALPEL